MCLRIGQRHSAACDIMSINGAPVPWANSLRYLGVTISSGHRFAVDLKQTRARFYRSFNALYCKIPRANECVIISLVKTFCVPLVTYSLEALCLNNSTLSSLDNMLYNAFGKIFKTYDRIGFVILHVLPELSANEIFILLIKGSIFYRRSQIMIILSYLCFLIFSANANCKLL